MGDWLGLYLGGWWHTLLPKRHSDAAYLATSARTHPRRSEPRCFNSTLIAHPFSEWEGMSVTRSRRGALPPAPMHQMPGFVPRTA